MTLTVVFAGLTGTVHTDEDIARVRARLAAGGWPLAPLHSVQPAGPDDD